MAQKRNIGCRSPTRKKSSLLSRPDWQIEINIARSQGTNEHWNERLVSVKDGQGDPAIITRFYVDLKQRVMQRFGNITHAFGEIDASGDGYINFVEWDSMLHLMTLPLENRIARWLFVRASGGEKYISLRDLKITLLGPTLKNLKSSFHAYKKIESRVTHHVQEFITHLTQCRQSIHIAAIDRFQRKLKVGCLRGLFERISSIPAVHQQIQSTRVEEIILEYPDFEDMACSMSSNRLEKGALTFLEYQVDILLNIFSRVAEIGNGFDSVLNRPGHILLVDLMTTLVILSPDVDRRGKLKLLFDVFDSDQDTVLQLNQVSDLFIWICKIRPTVFENSSSSGSAFLDTEDGITFHKELSMQEGLRYYECARWRLARQGNCESVVNFGELWQAIQDQPVVINSLAPGAPLIRWLAVGELAPVCRRLRRSRDREATRKDFFPKEMTPEHMELNETVEAFPKETAPRMLGKLPREVTPQRTTKQGNERVKEQKTAYPTLADSWPINTGKRIGSKSRGGTPAHKSRVAQTPPSSGALVQVEGRPLTTEFRRDAMESFQHRLRRLSDLRLTEMNEGFDNPYHSVSPCGSGEEPPDRGPVADQSATSPFRPSSTQQAKKSRLPVLRCSSSHNALLRGGKGRKEIQLGEPLDDSGMSQEKKLNLSSSASSFGRDDQCDHATLKWGSEATSRYRLLVAARHECRHGHKPVNMNSTDNFHYTCHLCEGRHALNI